MHDECGETQFVLHEGKMPQGEFRQAIVLGPYVPENSHRRVLLFNPAVYDTRFPWSQWQQPLTLLRLATLLRGNGCDVRLVDALDHNPAESLRRQRIRSIPRGNVAINYWRHGTSEAELTERLQSFINEKWLPEAVYIEGGTTYWWEGVQEAAKLVRRQFPKSVIVVCGAYAQYAVGHAITHVDADVVATHSIHGLDGKHVDLALYSTRPTFSYISIADRKTDDILHEIQDKSSFADRAGRVTRFAFADHDAAGRFPDQFRAVLFGVLSKHLKISLYALGNMHPRTLIAHPDLASLMKRAGFKQIVFSDDRDILINQDNRNTWTEICRAAVTICKEAGFRVRTEAVAATVSVGRPNEQIEEVTAHVARLAHAAGSLIPVPYQPLPEECPTGTPLELQNGKVFPFAEQNGATYREYQDVLGLAALLNAKYRSSTFDFLGEGLISKLLRESLTTGRWNPQNVPGGLQERPITVGWFNKEGKWVRS